MSDRYFYTARRSRLFVQSFTAFAGTDLVLDDVAGRATRRGDENEELCKPRGSRPSFAHNGLPSGCVVLVNVDPMFDPIDSVQAAAFVSLT